MFSGIVEEMGTVRRLEKLLEMPLWDGSVGEGWELEVEAATAAVADAATAPAPFTEDDRTVASAFDNASQMTEGPGFHRGYWQRAYGEALPTPGSLVA